MKIMQVAPAWIDTPPKDYGGTELIVHGLCEELVKMGHDVTLFATKNSRTSAKLDYVFEQNFIDQKIGWTLALPSLVHYHQAFTRAEEQGFDLIHAHLSSDTDTMILPLLDSVKIPKIITVHGLWPFDKVTNTDQYMMRFYIDKMPFVHISQAMLNMQPKELKPLGYVHNGIDLNNFKFNPSPKGYLTWLGKIKKDKGTGEAIQAALKTGEQLIFAGVVDEHVEEQVQYYEEFVKPFIDGDQIQYLGPADAKLKNEMLGNAKAFLNPIRWEEPFGMVMAESMATGTPVISYSRGAARELIVDGKTGFLIEENVDAMIDAIKKIDQLKREDSRKHVEDHLSAKAMTEGYFKMYERVLKGEIKSN